MKKKNLLLISMMFLIMSVSAQSTVWNPAGNDPSDGLWTTAANWTNGVPASIAGAKAVFNVDGAMASTVDAAVTPYQIVQGDGGSGDTIIVAGTGSVTTGAVWTAIGYNNPAVVIVESGGAFTFGQHAWIGMNAGATGTMEVYGNVVVSAQTGLGWTGGTGYVNVYDGGTFHSNQLNAITNGSPSISDESVIDIIGGTYSVSGDRIADVQAYIDAGRIIAYRGVSTLNVAFDGTKTVVTANPDETAPTVVSTIPADGGTDFPAAGTIKIEFSEPMNKASVEGAITFNPAITNVVYTWNGNTLSIKGDDLPVLQAYDVTIGTGAMDANGNALAAEYAFSFTVLDPNAPPVVVSTTPEDGDVDVAVDGVITFTFSKEMDSTSVVDSIRVMGINNMDYSWDAGFTVLTISYDNLDWEKEYTVTLLAGAEAGDGKVLAADYTFSFTTITQPETPIVYTGAGSDSLWTNPDNWDLGEVADGNYIVSFDTPDDSLIVLDDSVNVNYIQFGSKASPEDTLIITGDGSLIGDALHWGAIGLDSTATVIVEEGGLLTFGQHLWIGLEAGADANLHINGGTVTVGSMIGLDWGGNGNSDTIFINNGGVLHLANIHPDQSIGDNSAIVMTEGAIVLTGDHVSKILTYYNAGKIIGATDVTLKDGNTWVVGSPANKSFWTPMADGTNLITDFRNWSDFNVPHENIAVFQDTTTAVYNENDSIFINKIICGDGGLGGIIRVDSGEIVTGETWTGIGWTTPGTLNVEEGASFTFGQHMWIGWEEGGIGTVNINGGEVNSTGMFAVGGFATDGAAVGSSVNIYSGTLNLSNIHPTQSIYEGSSYVNIEDGELVVPIGKRNDTYNYVTQGLIMAYMGDGRVLWREEAGNVIFYGLLIEGAAAVIESSPADGDTVAITSDISMDFYSPMDKASVESDITVAPALSNPVFTWSDDSLSLTVSADDMAYDTEYTVTLGTSALDTAGNTLTEAYTFSFRTEAAPTYTVTFTVTDDNGPVEGATVTFNSTSETTDNEGVAGFDVANVTDAPYTVTKDGYEDATGTITVADAAVAEGVTLTLTVGILNQNSHMSVVYPNPAQDVIYLKGVSNAKMSIYSTSGQLIMTESGVSKMNVGTLSKGNYILKVTTEKSTLTNHLIIK